jgi:hypothetical protein
MSDGGGDGGLANTVLASNGHYTMQLHIFNLAGEQEDTQVGRQGGESTAAREGL